MFTSSIMFLGARVFLLLVPLVAALKPVVARAMESGDFAGPVDIGGGRKMHLECRGTGSPVVILEAGLRNRAEFGASSRNRRSGLSRRRGLHQSVRL